MKIIKLFLPLSLLALTLNAKAVEIDEEEVAVEETEAPKMNSRASETSTSSNDYDKLERLCQMHSAAVEKWLTIAQKMHNDKYDLLKRTLKDKEEMMKKYLPKFKDKPELIKAMLKDKLALIKKHAKMWREFGKKYADEKMAEANKQEKALAMFER